MHFHFVTLDMGIAMLGVENVLFIGLGAPLWHRWGPFRPLGDFWMTFGLHFESLSGSDGLKLPGLFPVHFPYRFLFEILTFTGLKTRFSSAKYCKHCVFAKKRFE